MASSLFTEERMVHAAPEVVRRPADATPASDQYSLGAILFFLLTGERAKPTSAVMSNHDLLALPSELVPRLPRELDDITFKMLDPQPKGRFEDLEAVRAQILQILGERVSLQRGSPSDPDDLAPGTELGSDYMVKDRLGRGGLSTVYLVDHRPSGTDRALKIARADQGAEDALRAEFKALHELNHPNLVKAVDLTKLVQNRLTLVLERVPGQALRDRLKAKVDLEPRLRRRFAEDLLSVLQYFEREEVVHKDLKPENLLVSDEDGLTVIDLSLVDISPDDLGVGTGAYRDPAMKAWDYGSDRYAAALCLFELHSGAHPFDHGPPEPGRVPETDPEWFDQPGLATFFAKALHPDPAHRFLSATAMLEAYRASLGPTDSSDESAALPTGSATFAADTPLTRLELSARALNALRRGGVHTAGDLVGMSEPQLRRLPNVGNRVFRQISRVQQRLVDAGLQPTKSGRQPERRLLYPQLADRKESLAALNLAKGELTALREGGFQTIGSVASSTRDELLSVRGVGRERLAAIVRQLVAFDVGDSQSKIPQTLDDFWTQATAPLSEDERTGLARRLALFGGSPETQADIGNRLGLSQPQVSVLLQRARESIKPEVLAHPIDLLEGWLEQLGGVVALRKAGERLEKRWPPEQISGEGFVRLLAELHPVQVKVVESSRLLGEPCVLGPEYEREDVMKFLEAAERLAEGWPHTSAEAVRRGLQGLL
ncbi:MAG: protein kinase, partial [Planctomycetota bacterium]|nr:protein kinase [Planctomycetota bacterium]